MQYYPPYVPYVPDPAQEEHRALRREGHFLGTGMLLLICLQQFLVSVVVIVLGLFGLTDFSALATDLYWGLDHTLFLFVYMGIYTVMMGVPLWFAALCFGVRRNPFGMHAPVRPAVFTAAVLIGLGGCTLSNLLTNTWINMWSIFGIELPNVDLYTEKSVLSLILNLIIFAALPALLEEMVFRGFVLQGMRGMGDPAAILFSALLFGLMHTNMLQLPFAFLLGLVMGFLVIKTGNIWVAIVIHFLNNGLSVLVDYAGLYIGEEGAGKLTTLIFSLLAIVGIAVLAVLLVRRSPLTTLPENKRTALLPNKRVAALMGSPCMWIALILFGILTLLITLLN